MSIKRNAGWNILGNVIPLLMGAASIPILIRNIGVESFGILTMLWVIIGYFSLFDFGVGRAITQKIAALSDSNIADESSAIVRAGIKFTVQAGGLGAILIGLLAYPLSYYGLGVSSEKCNDVFLSLLIAALGVPFATLSSGFKGAIEGFEKFKESNLARVLFGSAIFVFPLVSVWLNQDNLFQITSWLVVARVINCVHLFLIVRKLPCRNFFNAKVDKKTQKELLIFGAWMTVTNLISPLLVNIDRFFISYIMTAGLVAYYTLPFEFLIRILIFPGAVGSALLPVLARSAIKMPKEAEREYKKSLKIVAIGMLVMCGTSALLAFPLMSYFISEEFASKSWTVALILSVGVFVNGLAYIPYTSLHSKGLAKMTGILHISEFLIYIPIVFALTKIFGLTGAAVAWLLRVIIDAVALFFLNRRCI